MSGTDSTTTPRTTGLLARSAAHATGPCPALRIAPHAAPKFTLPSDNIELLVSLDGHADPELSRQAVELLATELDESVADTWNAWSAGNTVGRHAIVIDIGTGPLVVGAAYAMICDDAHGHAVARLAKDELDSEAAGDIRAIATLAAFERARHVGVLCAIAVHPEARLRGYARTMVGARQQLLEAMGCDVIYADTWIRDARHSSVTAYSNMGWYPLVEVPDFWERLYTELDLTCPESYKDCDGVVFVYDANRNTHVAPPNADGTSVSPPGLGR